MLQPSLYEMLTGYFTGGLEISAVSETQQVILSVMDNIQRIFNTRAGSVAHLPDYGLPDMTEILHGTTERSQQLLKTLSLILLKYEPRLKNVNVVLLQPDAQGKLLYAIDAELKEQGLVRYGTVFMPDGQVLIQHLRGQNHIGYAGIQ